MTGHRAYAFLTAAVFAASPLAAAEVERKATAAPRAVPAKRQRVVSDLSGFELLDAAELKDKPVVAGATRSLGGPPPPVILAPHLAKLHGTSAVFAWRHEAKRFAFVLSDDAGEEIHAAEVDGQNYRWPAAAPRLDDGKTYLWSVKPAGPSAALASMAAVAVVTPAERVAIDEALAAAKSSDPYADGLARGQAFVEKRVWYDAIGIYSDLIARFPDRPEAYERRATLYAQIPATVEQADDDFARADALAKK